MRPIIPRIVLVLLALALSACAAQDFKIAADAAAYCAKNPGHC